MTISGVYLLHFDTSYGHARHYIGFATNIDKRIHEHRAGKGSRLMTVIHDAGITFQVAQVWQHADRAFERKLKKRHGATRFCPLCKNL